MLAGGVVEHGGGVAGGVHARRGRLHVVVDHDRAVRQHVHLALEQVGVRQEADGQNRHFGRVLALFGDHSDGVVVIVAELDHLLAERERDAVLLERGRHLIGDGLIEIIGQRAIKAVDQRGLDAGDAELLGDFRADIARPDHHCRLGGFRLFLDGDGVIPVLAQQHMRAVDAGDRRDDRARAGGHDQFVESEGLFGGVSGLVQRAVGEGSGVEVHGRHVGAHMHGRAGFGQSGRGGVEHFLRVGYVVAHPQGDAAGEEGQRTVALENMDGPIGVLGENRGGGERAGVRAADDGDCGHECSFACGHGV